MSQMSLQTVPTQEPDNTKATAQTPFALIMKGGGVKGLAYVGALEQLEQYYHFRWFIGTSAGAIAAALLAAGYNANELGRILEGQDFRAFLDSPKRKWLTNLIFYGGLHRGLSLAAWIGNLVAEKLRSPIQVLLKDLPLRLTVYASTGGRKAFTFDSQDPQTRETPVSHAVRCSASIPLIFTPERRDGARILDGGLQNNYPVDSLLATYGATQFVGLYLGPAVFREHAAEPVLLRDLLAIWTDASDREALRTHRGHTVVIDPGPIGTLDFRIDEPEKDFLKKAGRAAALQFLVLQAFPNGPTAAEAADAAQEAHEARELVVRRRQATRTRRAATVVVALVLIAAAILWASFQSRPNRRPLTIDDLVNDLESCAGRRGCIICGGRGPCTLSASGIVEGIRVRPSSFVLCPSDEQRVRKAAGFLGQTGVDTLLNALRKLSLVETSPDLSMLSSTTGDETLDALVSRVVSNANGTFRLSAKHRFYCGDGIYLDSFGGHRYEILLGNQLLWLSQDGTPAGDSALYLIVAHELAHALQFEAKGTFPSGLLDRRSAELQADFMAGWFVGRLLESGNAPVELSDRSFDSIVVFAQKIGGLGSTGLSGVERHAAVTAGFVRAREADLAKAFAEAAQYASNHNR